MNDSIKEKIAIEVIKVLVKRFENFPEDASDNRNAPFHEAFLSAFTDKLKDNVPDTPFFISLSSWSHGLNTTLGQTFFEKVAHLLSNGEKREYTSKKLGNLVITQSQRKHISEIMADLSNSTKEPDLHQENDLVLIDSHDTLTKATDFSADVFLNDDDTITAIELKSVRPNSGEMKGEKQKILEGKAALHKKFSNKTIHFYIGFPFDPTIKPEEEDITGYNKLRFLRSIINMNKYFDPEETLLASELWNFLSGHDNTMEQILNIINKIATPEFKNKFDYIRDNENRNTKEYKTIIEEWFLYSENELLENDTILNEAVKDNKKLTRVYNKQPFDHEGHYSFDRYTKLCKVINENLHGI